MLLEEPLFWQHTVTSGGPINVLLGILSFGQGKVDMSSKIVLKLAGLTAIFAVLASCTDNSESCLTQICPDKVISQQTIQRWHVEKDANGPTFAGNTSWNAYLQLIEAQARQRGMVDFKRNYFTYQSWHTSSWPDTSGWSLTVDGESIEVSGAGANSGKTDARGINSELVYLNGDVTVSLQGKILVLSLLSTPLESQMPDWLYAPDDHQFPAGHHIRPEESIHNNTAFQLFAANLDGRLGLPGPHYMKLIRESGAAGVVVIFDMAKERVQGLYSFPVPPIYDIPTLYLGREAGTRLLAKMKPGITATLRLESWTEETTAYQFSGFLPGKNYGQDNDEIILMITHTDGPSISQENGPLGLLAVVHYFSQIKQSQRDKTLMFFLDARHYIPDREALLPAYNIDKVLIPGGALAPEHGNIVASVHLEHLGQLQYHEVDGVYKPTGKAEMGGYYVTPYQPIIDIARQALIEQKPQNQFLFATAIPGIHCKSQGIWYGLGHHPKKIGIRAIAANMAMMGAYWSTSADINYLDVPHFIRQANVMTQITGNFMVHDISALVAEQVSSPCEPQV